MNLRESTYQSTWSLSINLSFIYRHLFILVLIQPLSSHIGIILGTYKKIAWALDSAKHLYFTINIKSLKPWDHISSMEKGVLGRGTEEPWGLRVEGWGVEACGGGNMRNLTIIEEESCNISLKQDVIYQPVNNLMIFLSNQSILFSSWVSPFLCPICAPNRAQRAHSLFCALFWDT